MLSAICGLLLYILPKYVFLFQEYNYKSEHFLHQLNMWSVFNVILEDTFVSDEGLMHITAYIFDVYSTAALHMTPAFICFSFFILAGTKQLCFHICLLLTAKQDSLEHHLTCRSLLVNIRIKQFLPSCFTHMYHIALPYIWQLPFKLLPHEISGSLSHFTYAVR